MSRFENKRFQNIIFLKRDLIQRELVITSGVHFFLKNNSPLPSPAPRIYVERVESFKIGENLTVDIPF